MVQHKAPCQLCSFATLQARPNSIAVFVPSEITTYCFYPGLQRDFMVRNLSLLAWQFRSQPALKQTVWLAGTSWWQSSSANTAVQC